METYNGTKKWNKIGNKVVFQPEEEEENPFVLWKTENSEWKKNTIEEKV